jgi:hypothetical protein
MLPGHEMSEALDSTSYRRIHECNKKHPSFDAHGFRKVRRVPFPKVDWYRLLRSLVTAFLGHALPSVINYDMGHHSKRVRRIIGWIHTLSHA